GTREAPPSRCEWRQQGIRGPVPRRHPSLSPVASGRFVLIAASATDSPQQDWTGADRMVRSGGTMNRVERDIANLPDITVSAREVFNIDFDIEVPAFSAPDAHVPDVDPDYLFDP